MSGALPDGYVFNTAEPVDPPEPDEVRVTIYVTLSEAEWQRFTDVEDLESSVRARLSEVYDGDGNPVEPNVIGIDVE